MGDPHQGIAGATLRRCDVVESHVAGPMDTHLLQAAVPPLLPQLRKAMGYGTPMSGTPDAGAFGGLGLGPIDQVGYVVADLDASLPRYEALFGPFRVSEAALSDCEMGERRVDCRLKLAVQDAGPVEIELIQVLEGETPHTEHLRAHGEGPHHVRFRVDDLEAKCGELAAQGFVRRFYKRFGPSVAFAYLETPPELGGSLIELLEMP